MAPALFLWGKGEWGEQLEDEGWGIVTALIFVGYGRRGRVVGGKGGG